MSYCTVLTVRPIHNVASFADRRAVLSIKITESYVVGALSEFVVGSMGYYSKVALATVTMQEVLSFKR